MKLTIERFGFGKDSTLGRLLMDGNPVAFVIEDERRAVKVRGETCIPVGHYTLKLRTEGGLHAKYAERFRGLHEGMLWISDVPGFEWVYLHVGNTDDDSEGCPLLVGTPAILGDGEFQGSGSEVAYKLVYGKVLKALKAGEAVTVMVSERGPE